MPSLNVIAYILSKILQVKSSPVWDAQVHKLGSSISKFANVFANSYGILSQKWRGGSHQDIIRIHVTFIRKVCITQILMVYMCANNQRNTTTCLLLEWQTLVIDSHVGGINLSHLEHLSLSLKHKYLYCTVGFLRAMVLNADYLDRCSHSLTVHWTKLLCNICLRWGDKYILLFQGRWI